MSATDASVDDVPAMVAAVGTNVRRERHRQGLSVESLSKRAGVSFGLISELERGKGNPSLQTLTRLATALDLPLSILLAESPRDAMVVRAHERHVLASYRDDGAPEAVRELLSPRAHSMLQVIRTSLPPGFSNEGAPFRHVGTEAVVVETGSLIVNHGDSVVTLGVGDSITYRCSVPHWWANGHDAPTVVQGSFTPFED